MKIIIVFYLLFSGVSSFCKYYMTCKYLISVNLFQKEISRTMKLDMLMLQVRDIPISQLHVQS